MPQFKILLDSSIWAGAKQELIEAGFNVKWVGDFLEDPGDMAIIRLAFQEDRILITLDKDFGELAIFKGEPHQGIIRIFNCSATKHGQISIDILKRYKAELINHAFITVGQGRVRIRVAEF